MRHSNKLLYKSTDRQKFATLFYGILDSQQHQLCYTNAGHNRPFFARSGEAPLFLENAGIALSFVENFIYEEDVVFFKPGDLLLIYSDGITEAMDINDQDFGEEKLVTLVNENIENSATEIIEKIMSAVKEHAGKRSQMDDMTIVAIIREKR